MNANSGCNIQEGNGVDFKTVLDHLSAAVIVIDNGRIAYANQAFCRWCGKSQSELAGTAYLDWIAAADRAAVKGFIEKKDTGDRSDTIEFTLLRPDGGCLVEMKATVVDFTIQPVIIGVLTDISERRRARLELQRMRDRLESIIYSMNDVVISFSPETNAIIAINPSAEALFGVALRDFQLGNKTVMDFVHPDDLEAVTRFYQRIKDVEFDDLAYRILCSKIVKWVWDEGRIVYGEKGRVRRIDHVIRDITEEKTALDALKQSEEKYRSFFETTSDMAYSVKPDGTFLDINAAGVKLIGFESRQQALASNIEDSWVNPPEREKLISELKNSGQVTAMRTLLKNKEGKIFEASITARAKTNEEGDIISYEGLVHNITKALEDQRNRVLRNAAGGLCHYLNTHLANLSICQECMLQDLKSLEKLHHSLPGGDRAVWREKLDSLQESFDGARSAYEKIAQVTSAFNSAFLTYAEEAYLDHTILDIFHMYGAQPDRDDGEKP